MANPNQPSTHSSSEPSDRKVLFSAIAWVGAMLIFVLITLIAYVVPQRGSEDYGGALYDDARVEIYDRVSSSQQQIAQNYRWVNEDAGTVRIPIEQAKAIIVRELQAAQDGRPE